MPDADPSLRVAVLMGGINSEQDVSMDSGQRILQALTELGHQPFPVIYEGDPGACLSDLAKGDIVFNALHGGDGENGVLQQFFENHGLAYTGSGPVASSLAMDKHESKLIMRRLDIPTAPWMRIQFPEPETTIISAAEVPMFDEFLDKNGFPLVIKPNCEGSTVGISICASRDSLDEALIIAAAFDGEVILERFIPGRELTITILDGTAMPIVEIIPKHGIYDYQAKYQASDTIYQVPARLEDRATESFQQQALALFNALGCRHYARVDLRLQEDGAAYFLELNTLPGMTTHSLTPMSAAAAGIEFPSLVKQIAMLAYESARARS